MKHLEHKNKILAIAGVIVMVAGLLSYLYYQYDITWEQVKESVQNAPGWIFITTLFLLPPLGLPLSLFLFAVGARFGLWIGALLACGAVVGHHFIAVAISHTFSRFFSVSQSQQKLWQTLEQKTGGNSKKLLFLWGLLPGLPYIVKLYLPLGMGVKNSPYLRWNSAGHAIGAIMFVGFGNAVFGGLSVGVIVIIIAGIALSIGLKIFRDRINKAASKRNTPVADAT